MIASPHSASHAAVLARAGVEGVGDVDAVIVPSGRTPDHTRHAAELAAELGSVLLVLCSAASSAAGVAAVVRDVDGLGWHAADVGATLTHPLLPRRPALPGHGGRVSLSRKRNLGLLAARTAGWDTVLFLDDDIRGLGADAVRLAAGALDAGGAGPASAVGFAVTEWPDNSVACHANRLGGAEQDVFVGGSALLVDVAAPEIAHFPTVYNEDWLFLFDALDARRVQRGGVVGQLPYDPFGDPARGRSEEFGEIVAEGLVAHLEDGGRGVPLSPDYWAGFLRRRAAFLACARRRLGAGTASPRHRAARCALDAASARCAEIRPAQCVRFLRGWRADRDEWRHTLDGVTPADDVPDALHRLGLTGTRSDRAEGPSTRPARLRPPLDATVHRAADPSGTALIVPGFLDGRDSLAHRSMARALPAVGLTSVTFDPRGTATGREPLAAGTTEHLADLTALLDRHPATGRQVLVGHCYGAWLAGLLAARDPRVGEVVAVMPTRCFLWPTDYDEAADRWRRLGERVFNTPVPGSTALRGVRVPHAVVEDARRYDLPAALASLRQPILFVAGDADEVVPAAAVRRLHDECGSPDKTLVVLPGVEHDYRDHPDQLAVVEQTVVSWLARRRARAAAS